MYETDEFIAEGGYSKVYLARNKKTGDQVVIKKSEPLDEELIEREIYILKKLYVIFENFIFKGK